jgi:hypothetical protein
MIFITIAYYDIKVWKMEEKMSQSGIFFLLWRGAARDAAAASLRTPPELLFYLSKSRG